MLSVVNTAYHEQPSATAIIGTTASEAPRTKRLPVTRALWTRKSAHWTAKQSSATVATDRPTATLDTQESVRTSRGMSKTGSTERKAHPKTYAAQNTSCRRRPA